MLHFTPTSYLNHRRLVSPRDNYFTALAETRLAEAEYLSALAREKAAKRIREERDQAIFKQLLLDSLYNGEVTYPTDDPFSSTYPVRALLTAYPARQLSRGFYPEDLLPYHQEEEEEEHIFSTLRRRQHAAERLELELRQQEEKKLARLALIQQERLRQLQTDRRRERVHCRCAGVDQNVLSGGCSQNVVEQKEAQQSQRKPFTQSELLAYLSGLRSEPVDASGPRQQKNRPSVTLDDLLAHFLGVVAPKDQQQHGHSVAKPASEPQAQPSSSAPPEVHPEARNPEVEFRDTIKALVSTLFNPAHAAPESQPTTQTPVPQATKAQTESHASNAASVVTPPLSTPVSLKEQLEARLLSDADAEIRDTIQALIASLHPSASGPSTPDVKVDTPVAEGSGKGKAKQVTFDVPIAAPTSLDVMHAVETVRNVEVSFNALESNFVFPSNLDFDVDSASSASLPSSSALKLAYTSKNAPVRLYEHALSSMLTELDSVDSLGNEELRNKRKEVVAKVEAALDSAEREIEGRSRVWGKKHVAAETAGKVEVKAENVEVGEASGPGKTLESEQAESVADVIVQSPVPVVEESSPVTREEQVRSAAAEESLFSTTTSEEPVSSPTPSSFVKSSGDGLEVSDQSTTVEVEVHEDLTEVPIIAEPNPPSSSTDSIVSPVTESTHVDNAAPFPDATGDTDAVDTFLLPASPKLSGRDISSHTMLRHDDSGGDEIVVSRDDAGSDWSEVEA